MKNLQRCLAENLIQPHTPSRRETAELLGVVDRDLADARIALLSCDRRFATAYNAALQLSTIVLRAADVTDYDRAGSTSEGEVTELIREVEEFREHVMSWLAPCHPDLLPG